MLKVGHYAKTSQNCPKLAYLKHNFYSNFWLDEYFLEFALFGIQRDSYLNLLQNYCTIMVKIAYFLPLLNQQYAIIKSIKMLRMRVFWIPCANLKTHVANKPIQSNFDVFQVKTAHSGHL